MPGTATQPTEATPLYKRWWLWTGVGAVVAGAVVTSILVTTQGGSDTVSPGSGSGADHTADWRTR